MKVLHYSLGIPPFRAGGLPRYTLDIARTELQLGHQVSILYPEGIDYKYPSFHIIKSKEIDGIQTYKLKNPTLVPILYGVSNPDKMIKESKYDVEVVRVFLGELKPDIVHFHSIMGLSLGVVSEIKRMGIRTVLTTHDYYGLCFKGNFIDSIGNLCEERNLEKCSLCNQDAPSESILRAISEPLLKPIIRCLQKRTNISDMSHKSGNQNKKNNNNTFSYNKLLKYYENIFKEMDIVHFNSTQTAEQYLKYIKLDNFVVIPVTDSYVQDRRCIKVFRNDEKLKLGYIGVLKPYKGFYSLRNVLREIKGGKWELFVWGNHIGSDEEFTNIHYMGMYNTDTIRSVFDRIDMLIVPSIWYETFSLVTLEALSFGVPVLVSHSVGAKDLVGKYDRTFIYTSQEQLKSMLVTLTKDKGLLKEYNQRIMKLPFPYTIKDHVLEIIEKLYIDNYA